MFMFMFIFIIFRFRFRFRFRLSTQHVAARPCPVQSSALLSTKAKKPRRKSLPRISTHIHTSQLLILGRGQVGISSEHAPPNADHHHTTIQTTHEQSFYPPSQIENTHSLLHRQLHKSPTTTTHPPSSPCGVL